MLRWDLLESILVLSLTNLASSVPFDENMLHIGLIGPQFGGGSFVGTTSTIYADLEFGKYRDPPLHQFRRADGSLIEHYLPLPNIHPNLTQLRLHIKDSGRTRQKAAVSAVEFAYGSEAEDMPPVNAVLGPFLDEPSISASSILSVLQVVQISSGARSELFTDKSSYPYLFRVSASNSESGIAMWDYLEYFGWRTGCMVSEDVPYGNELRLGMAAQAEARRRSGDISFYILPELVGEFATEDGIFAAEVAAQRVADELISSFNRLIFFAIVNFSGLETVVRRIFFSAGVTAPYFQIVLGYISKSFLVDRDRHEGHPPETFHGLSEVTDPDDPSLVLFEESWTSLTAETILDRLPIYGLPRAALDGTDEDITAILQTFPPPGGSLIMGIHLAYNALLRAFNNMLNDGYRPPQIQGAALRQYMRNVTYDGFGVRLEFNENNDVVRDVLLSSAIGFDAFNRTIWTRVAIRKPHHRRDVAQIIPVPGSAGPMWATGEYSWRPPLSLSACPLGTLLRLSDSGLGNPSANNGSRVAGGTCEECPSGHFSSTYNALNCSLCSGGTFSVQQGSSECTICPTGSFAVEGSTACTPCFAGSVGDEAGMSACRDCPPGKFQNTAGQTRCDDCLVGSHASSSRSEQCGLCQPGSIAPIPGSASCSGCAAGFFQDGTGASACVPCGSGSFAEAVGQASCSPCNPGSYQPNMSSPLQCERCPVGTYSETVGASACVECSLGTTLLLGADSSALCTCPPGSFYYESFQQRACMPCNEYMEPCPGGTQPAFQKEWYHVNVNGQVVYQCLSVDACPGGPLESCPKGSSGPGCFECDSGSYYWHGDKCAECMVGNSISVVLLPIVIVIMLLGTHRFGNDPIGRQHLSAVSQCIVLGGLLLSIVFFFSSFEALDVDWKEPLATLMDLTRLFSTELINVDFSCSVSMSPSASMVFTSSIPVLALMPAIPLAMLKIASPPLLFNTCGSIVYATYLLLVLHGLKPLRYIVHPMGDKKSVLFMPSIFEHSAEHSRLIVVGVAVLLLYCVPFAALCGWASIAVMRRSATLDQRRLFLKLFRFLFYKFRPRSYYWGFYILIRNTIVGVTPSLFPESPAAGVFILSAMIIKSAVATGIVWPWRTRWMNYLDTSALAYMALVLNLAVGWVRTDEDSDGAMATILVVAAGVLSFVGAVFAFRLLWRVATSGTEARSRMRAQAEADEEAIEAGLMAHFAKYDQNVEMADGFESLMKEMDPAVQHRAGKDELSLAPALTWVSQQTFEVAQAASIASQIRKQDYSLQSFYEDCMLTFPELQLYKMSDGLPPEEDGGKGGMSTSGGLSGEAEQKRTIGALFAIYWICRLDMDGKQGMSFGVEPENTYHVREARSIMEEPVMEEREPSMNWGAMTPDQRRAHFYHDFDWDLMTEVFANAGIIMPAGEGVHNSCRLDDGPGGRLVSLLCLTAFHDIMKCSALCPTVHGEPYEGYAVGETIQDHDLALAYVLDRHADLLPSFRSLSEEQRRSIRFTQSDMGFNAGWLVQAEGPPGAVLSKLKRAITSGMASDVDVAFYFSHFLTDLAGAEPTPFRGAEKYSVKFPPKVLQGLLGCVGTVKQLALESETKVYESYLEKRWREVSDQLGPVPKGPGRIAKLRLNCMAQHAAKPVLDAFQSLDAEDYELLVKELSQTGLPGQLFSEIADEPRGECREGLRPCDVADTPFLMYYGPAWCQRAGDNHPSFCLQVLATVLRLARQTFAEANRREEEANKTEEGKREQQQQQKSCYTIQLAALRTIDIGELRMVLEVVAVEDREETEASRLNTAALDMELQNHLECSLVISVFSA